MVTTKYFYIFPKQNSAFVSPSPDRFNTSIQRLFTGKGKKKKNVANGNAASGSELEDGNGCYDNVWDDPTLPLLGTGKADQTGRDLGNKVPLWVGWVKGETVDLVASQCPKRDYKSHLCLWLKREWSWKPLGTSCKFSWGLETDKAWNPFFTWVLKNKQVLSKYSKAFAFSVYRFYCRVCLGHEGHGLCVLSHQLRLNMSPQPSKVACSVKLLHSLSKVLGSRVGFLEDCGDKWILQPSPCPSSALCWLGGKNFLLLCFLSCSLSLSYVHNYQLIPSQIISYFLSQIDSLCTSFSLSHWQQLSHYWLHIHIFSLSSLNVLLT